MSAQQNEESPVADITAYQAPAGAMLQCYQTATDGDRASSRRRLVAVKRDAALH